ncbi:hypothetical protein AHAS_Ahas19G0311900 [Arachis hypogaea]
MNIVPNNDIVLIKFQRRQFLLMMSFGVKINKAQIENREIPKMIGDIKLSIDLSHNHFCGAIPRSMIDLTFLSHLNLSYNNLSGPIPGENQFQSLNDPLSYAVNQYLCGAPLPKHRPGLVLIMFPTLKAMKMKTVK